MDEEILQARIDIDAPAERIYDLIADITKMGRWSPECTGGRWLGDVREPAPGSRFLGFNKQGWARWVTWCEVTTADRGHEFAFVVKPVGVTWRYRLEPGPAGSTTVIETRELPLHSWIAKLGARLLPVEDHDQVLAEGMEETLRRIKAAAEQA